MLPVSVGIAVAHAASSSVGKSMSWQTGDIHTSLSLVQRCHGVLDPRRWTTSPSYAHTYIQTASLFISNGDIQIKLIITITLLSLTVTAIGLFANRRRRTCTPYVVPSGQVNFSFTTPVKIDTEQVYHVQYAVYLWHIWELSRITGWQLSAKQPGDIALYKYNAANQHCRHLLRQRELRKERRQQQIGK